MSNAQKRHLHPNAQLQLQQTSELIPPQINYNGQQLRPHQLSPNLLSPQQTIKLGILAHQAQLLSPQSQDGAAHIFKKQTSNVAGNFIQKQQELPEDDGTKLIALTQNKQQQQQSQKEQLQQQSSQKKQKNQQLLMSQLQDLDQELKTHKLVQRYDTTTHALQKKKQNIHQDENELSENIEAENDSKNDESKKSSLKSGFLYSQRNNSSIKEEQELNQSTTGLIKSNKSSKKSKNQQNQNFSICSRFLNWCKGGNTQNQVALDENDYSSGESDTEFETPYELLSFQEKQDRVKYLWHRAFLKSKGAAHILAKFGELNKKIYLYGAARKGDEHEDENAIMIKNKKCIIMPDNKFKAYWNLVITVLLLYTASYVPYKIAFIDNDTTASIVFDTLVDGVFLTDCIMGFFTAYEDKKVGIEVRHRVIALSYLKSWFGIDVLSCFPMQLVELYIEEQSLAASKSKHSQTSSYKLLRLMRLPRLYRLIRLLRIFKMLRLFKNQSQMRRIMDSIKMNAGVVRMISVTITVFFLVHLIGCIWFLSAKLDDFNPDTWVVRFDYIDDDPGIQYLAGIYWALQTLTTVGFGDINAKTIPEKIIAILWMIFGVGFYSFTIGNLSQIIASIDTQSAILSQKLSILSEFAKRTNLPTEVMFRIRRHLENNNKHQNNLEEQEKLLNDLPAALRSEVVKHTHGEIIQKINFFREKDPDFLWAILPALRPIKLLPTDVLYTQGDHSDEIYFIKKGRVKLYVDVNENNPDAQEPLNIAFIAYVEGSYFGDSDIFFQDENKGRDSTAVADTECHLLVLSRKDLMALGDDFEDISKEMREIARERKTNHEDLVNQTLREHMQQRAHDNMQIMVNGSGSRTPRNRPGDVTTVNVFRNQGLGDRTNRSRSQSPRLGLINDRTAANSNGGSGGLLRAGMFSDVVSKLNTHGNSHLQSQLSSVPAPLNDQLLQREIQLNTGKRDLEHRQKKFREEYNETLVNFQNNMNFLSIHADEIQNMFVKYQSERQKIMGAMTQMKDQAQILKNNSEFLKSSLDLIIENMAK